MTFTIGLTGGIGSGKSTVASLFAQTGVPVFDTDAIAKELVAPGKPALKELIAVLGTDIVTENGELNRQELKRLIFEDNKSRELVESVLHPKIRQQLLSMINSCSSPYCIAVIPLLIEKNWQNIVDRVLVVDLPEAMQRSRASLRDHVSENIISQIMHTQVTRAVRLANADDIIDNSQNEQSLLEQVRLLHEKYLSFAGHNRK